MEYLNYSNKRTRHIASIPFIWSALIPFVALDILISIVQQVVFYLYDLEHIDRSKYIKIDRYKLTYLSIFDKVNCIYCAYANGLMAYATAIVAQLELYWCGIKHENIKGFVEPDHHCNFIDYDDKEAFDKEYVE